MTSNTTWARSPSDNDGETLFVRVRGDAPDEVAVGAHEIDLADVSSVLFRPGFQEGTDRPALWADIEFDSGDVESVFDQAAEHLRQDLEARL